MGKSFGRVQESATVPGASVVTVEAADLPYGPHVWISATTGAPLLDVAAAESVIRALGAFIAERGLPRPVLSEAEVETLAADDHPAVSRLAAEVRRLRRVIEGEALLAERGGLERAALRLRRSVVPLALVVEPGEPVERADRLAAAELAPAREVLGAALRAAGTFLHRHTLNVPSYAALAAEARRAPELDDDARRKLAASMLDVLERRARVPVELVRDLRGALDALEPPERRERSL